MHGNHHDHKESICVNVDKVYDWIMKEVTFDISLTGPITFAGVTAGLDLADAIVTCEVEPAASNPIQILNREDRQFSINGRNVTLQQLTIRKNFTVTITVTLPTGPVYTSGPNAASRNERVTLCAPTGTDVEITYTELDCFVTSTGTLTAGEGTITFSDLDISLATCQSIQSTYPVTVKMLADFCEPREDFVVACSTPSRPPQCSSLFPSNRPRRFNDPQ